jgi:hypothetical protein
MPMSHAMPCRGSMGQTWPWVGLDTASLSSQHSSTIATRLYTSTALVLVDHTDWFGRKGWCCMRLHAHEEISAESTDWPASRAIYAKAWCQARCGHLACKSMSRPAHTTCRAASTAGRRVDTAAIWYWFSGHYRVLPGTSSACLVFAVKSICRCNGWLVDGQAWAKLESCVGAAVKGAWS